MTELHFLPWLRRGLATDIADPDQGSGPIARAAPLEAWIEVDGIRATSEVRMRPADHVTGIDLTQVARRYPAPGSRNVETGYWPLIDFTAPDLPWAMTAAAPDGSSDGRLRPWLVLVCVSEATSAIEAARTDQPAILSAPIEELPDLADSAEWAHVQSTVPAEDAATNAGVPGVVTARLIAPAVLQPEKTYRVALVPAFRPSSDSELVPSWSPSDSGTVTVTTYDSWTFTTGRASTFEEVVGLLGPVDPALDLNLGVTPVDVTDLGAVDPWPEEELVVVDYAGALVDTDLQPTKLGKFNDEFNKEVSYVVDQGTGRPDISEDDPDPIVAPPLFGSFAASTYTIPEYEGWVHALNLTIRHRMAAGLGAETVRRNQERYMAAAWQQAGDVIEARRALNASRLQAEVSRTWKDRTDDLDPAQHAAVLRPQYTTVRSANDEPARAALGFSGIPNGMFDLAMARMTRRGTAVDRTASRREQAANREQPNPTGWQTRVGSLMGDPDHRKSMAFGAVAVGGGAFLSGPDGVTFQPRKGSDNPVLPTSATRFTESRPDTLSLPGFTTKARQQITPMRATRSRVDARITGLADLLSTIGWPADEIPTRVKIGPTIDEALVWALLEQSAELLMPGASEFPDNAVRLVQANAGFVAAFLAGANHEMSREMLWREYPADMGSTTFHRFWDRPPGQQDIDDMADWPAKDQLPTIGTSGGESVVLLARGDVFRLYPNLQIFLRPPNSDTLQAPLFGGQIPPATRFFAFDVESAADIYAGGWKVVFQEPLTEPRFGSDEDVAIDYRNSAHFAATTYQAPFRQQFDVIDIIGEGGS